MTDISVVLASGLAVGFAVGYAVRAAISLRRRQAAMKGRYLFSRPDLGERWPSRLVATAAEGYLAGQ